MKWSKTEMKKGDRVRMIKPCHSKCSGQETDCERQFLNMKGTITYIGPGQYPFSNSVTIDIKFDGTPQHCTAMTPDCFEVIE